MVCGVDRYCIKKVSNVVSSDTPRLCLVSQSELAVQQPRLKRGDMEHNGGVLLRWRQGNVETLQR